MAAAAWLGGWFAVAADADADDTREDFNIMLAATLTLLGLIIGFTFSMAVSRYDQRKNLEEEEANAIGTEYLRADLLPGPHAAKVAALLRDYTSERIRFYVTRDGARSTQIDARTAKLQADLWAAVRDPALRQSRPADADRGDRHQRRHQLAGLHAGRLVEPHPARGVDSDVRSPSARISWSAGREGPEGGAARCCRCCRWWSRSPSS